MATIKNYKDACALIPKLSTKEKQKEIIKVCVDKKVITKEQGDKLAIKLGLKKSAKKETIKVSVSKNETKKTTKKTTKKETKKTTEKKSKAPKKRKKRAKMTEEQKLVRRAKMNGWTIEEQKQYDKDRLKEKLEKSAWKREALSPMSMTQREAKRRSHYNSKHPDFLKALENTPSIFKDGRSEEALLRDWKKPAPKMDKVDKKTGQPYALVKTKKGDLRRIKSFKRADGKWGI